jgi:hypothetical protein
LQIPSRAGVCRGSAEGVLLEGRSAEAFDPQSYLSINPDDGWLITGLLSFNGVLLIFKERGVYALLGDSPDNWTIQQIDRSTGAPRIARFAWANNIAYFWSQHGGPSMLVGADKVDSIGFPSLQASLGSTTIALDQLPLIAAAAQPDHERIIFAVPESGHSRNTIYLPYNYRLGVWESNKWYGIDAASLALSSDSTSVPWVYIGGYKGQVFQLWNATNDGVPSGTKHGTVTSATSTTLSDSTASFLTTGGGLIERYVIAIDPANTPGAEAEDYGEHGHPVDRDSGVVLNPNLCVDLPNRLD